MSINFNKSCGCPVPQILNITNYAFNDISKLKIFDDCGNEYDLTKLEYSYSLDNVCWSCYMSYTELLEVTTELVQDFYLRVKIGGVIKSVNIEGLEYVSYSTQLDSSLKIEPSKNVSENLYNPYVNLDCAMSLYQTMTETISNVIGIPCYYFKLSPSAKSKDITFKEYTLMDVSAVKQIKIILQDNQMPSSKPEFSDWGMDFATDWEVEVSKFSFATAFGNTAQPMEGDLVYIPMMKRMWMVNGAYEEKKDAFMWNATTFKLVLVKYQEKDSVDLGNHEDLINSFVKNKYEDLFGDEENVGSGFDTVNNEVDYLGKQYNIYESDAIRKSLNIDMMEIQAKSLYYRGTLISDMYYHFIFAEQTKQIEYQFKFCGDNGVISFIICPEKAVLAKYPLIQIGNLQILIEQNSARTILTNVNTGASLKLINGETYFVYLRWNKQMNLIEFCAARYLANTNVPLYKLQPAHYYFDVDGTKEKVVLKYNNEIAVTTKSNIIVNNFKGSFTNFKVFDEYVSDVSSIMQMYPTNNHLIVNDTARKIVSTISGSQV